MLARYRTFKGIRLTDASSVQCTSITAIMVAMASRTQALVSIVEDGLKDTLHSIQAGRHSIVFMKKDPLILVVVGEHKESERYVCRLVREHAVIPSFFGMSSGGDGVREVKAGRAPISCIGLATLLSFLISCISLTHFPSTLYQLHQLLGAVHRQILSILTRTQLERAMQHKANYDLRRLLGGMVPPWTLFLLHRKQAGWPNADGR